MDTKLEPFMWWVARSANIVKKFQSYDRLLINDNECADVLLQQMALEVVVENLRHKNALSCVTTWQQSHGFVGWHQS